MQRIIECVAASNGSEMTPDQLVDQCVDLIGPLDVSERTRLELINHAAEEGELSWVGGDAHQRSSERVGEMLALIAATTEYQFG